MSNEWITIQSLGNCCGYDNMNKTALVCENVPDCKTVLEENLVRLSCSVAISAVVFFVIFMIMTVSSYQQMLVDKRFHYPCFF